MSYITLGNLTRFFDKLKNYLDGKYLKNGGTASSLNVKALRMSTDIGSKDTPKITFTNNINSEIVSLYGLQSSVSDKSLIASIDGSNYTVLHTGNAYSYFPSKTGSGATGTWAINISGNALNDSDGNKIVDTYAKKSETSSAPDLTKYMKKSADSSLDMKEYPICFGYAKISLNDGFTIDGTGDIVKIKGTSLFFNNSRIDTREDNQKLYAPQASPTFTGTVTAPNITVSTSLTIPGGKIWIA